jgi:hypothetical protein
MADCLERVNRTPHVLPHLFKPFQQTGSIGSLRQAVCGGVSIGAERSGNPEPIQRLLMN